MGVKISALPTATQAEAASGLIPVVTDPNGDGNLVTKHITASSIGGGGANVNTSSTPPSNPSNGDLWFDEGNAELYIYNSSINGWIQTNGGGGGGSGSTTSAGPAVRALLRVRTPSQSNPATLIGSTWHYSTDLSYNIASITNKNGNTLLTVTFENPIDDPFVVSPTHQLTTYASANGFTGDGNLSSVSVKTTSTGGTATVNQNVGFTYNSDNLVSGLTLSGAVFSIGTNSNNASIYGLIVY